MFIHFF